MSYIFNLVYHDAAELGTAAASYIATTLGDAIEVRGAASWCVAGGSTPRMAYETLATAHADDVEWGRVSIWFGDERCVAPDDDRSNFRMVDRALLTRVPIALPDVHRIAGELDVGAAARAYDAELRSFFTGAELEPSFDLLLLGVGSDGHVASLFPGRASLNETSQWAVAEPEPGTEPRVPRVTLTPPILRRARKVLFLVSGTGKRKVTHQVLLEDAALPASAIRGLEQTLWIMDEDAAPT